MNNELYLRRRRRVWVEAGSEDVAPELLATLLKNIEGLGFTLSLELQARVSTLSPTDLYAFYQTLTGDLRGLVGGHVKWKPLYPNFPTQVMELSASRLYLNALVHYLTNQPLVFESEARPPLDEKVQLKTIELGSVEDFEAIFRDSAGAKTSISAGDKTDLRWFVLHYRDDIVRLLPTEVPNRENLAVLGAALLDAQVGADWLCSQINTATDVLRLAVALHGGDVSLASRRKLGDMHRAARAQQKMLLERKEAYADNATYRTHFERMLEASHKSEQEEAELLKFGQFSRPRRKFLLGLLEGCPNLTEDMLRWQKLWVRLGERLHPGEWARRFPQTLAAFEVVRGNRPFATFNSNVEAALHRQSVLHRQSTLQRQGAVGSGVDAENGTESVPGSVEEARGGSEPALGLLQSRPGEFARRLDHLLRLDPEGAATVLETFATVADRVSTPVLLQVLTHFQHRAQPQDLRIFFPKGEVAKVWGQVSDRPPLDAALCESVTARLTAVLTARFALLPPLGACYLDEELRNYLVPFSQRSASKTLRTLARGSRLSLPDANTIRFFLWWRNGRERTDIDLSAALYGADFVYRDIISYYNLKNYGGHHSGDIVNAPQGAAEFIDLDRAKMLEKGVRYVVMAVNSYTEQPYYDLPECFAGWMAREKPNSGEIFEPRTVQDRIDLSADTSICLPLVLDLETGTAVWMDLALRQHPDWNNVQNNLKGVSLMLRAMLSLQKTTLYDLFALHIAARGERVGDKTEAQQVFSVTEGLTPFDLDTIAAQWM